MQFQLAKLVVLFLKINFTWGHDKGTLNTGHGGNDLRIKDKSRSTKWSLPQPPKEDKDRYRTQ